MDILNRREGCNTARKTGLWVLAAALLCIQPACRVADSGAGAEPGVNESSAVESGGGASSGANPDSSPGPADSAPTRPDPGSADPDNDESADETGSLPDPAAPGNDTQPASVRVLIDEELIPSQAELAPRPDGTRRIVGLAVGPDGMREEFVTDEVVFHPESADQLAEFLEQYNGVVMQDGTRTPPPDIEPIADDPGSGYYLIRINPQRFDHEDLAVNLDAMDIEGEVAFSSAEAAGLAAVVVREIDRELSPNLLVAPTSVLEHPDGTGGNVVADDWPWMSESQPFYSTGVIRAWDYLRYHDLPPTPAPGETIEREPPTVAVIDRGFALDESTGMPLLGNQDYFAYGGAPYQYDFDANDNRAGGQNFNIIGPIERRKASWHGSKVFGVCCAQSRNLYGGAGTGGPTVVPILLKVDQAYSLADAIRYSALWYGADVINISLGLDCGLFCGLADARDSLQNAVYTAVTFDSIVVAAAGNEGIDLAEADFVPCELDGVICVGGVNQSGAGEDIVNIYNFGEAVDLWAPVGFGTDGLYTTVTPDSAALDANDVGLDELDTISGTSAATPFVSGIVALMRLMEPSITRHDVQNILQATANAADDPKVASGYVDAFRALKAIRPNQPPTVRFVEPQDGETVSYGSVRLRAAVFDPEPGATLEDVVVVFVSESDAAEPGCPAHLEYDSQGQPFMVCNKRFTNGDNQTHVMRVYATDPFGEIGHDTVTINVVNIPPNIEILAPDPGATFFAHQPIGLGAYINDAEQLPFPNAGVSWSSDIDGELGTGWLITVNLSPGQHTVTGRAVDEMGAAAEDTIIINVLAGEGVPEAAIQSPDHGASFGPGTSIAFTATGSDPEDGMLPDSAFRWFSNVDGFLGSGTSITSELSGPNPPCSQEFVVHVITLEVTDADGHTITYSITVNIGQVC
jgi:hypothetical protein